VIELERVPLASGATHEDLAFGEDYELLAATPEPGNFAVIGRCEAGAGVEIRLAGQAVALYGWEHFRLRK
jgi:thiamine monophosphate kinase